MNYEVGRWGGQCVRVAGGDGEVGKWGSGEVGSGEVGKWGSGEVGKWGSGHLGTCVGIISQSIGGRKLCAPTVTDFVHNVGANCVRPKGTLSKRKSLS